MENPVAFNDLLTVYNAHTPPTGLYWTLVPQIPRVPPEPLAAPEDMTAAGWAMDQHRDADGRLRGLLDITLT